MAAGSTLAPDRTFVLPVDSVSYPAAISAAVADAVQAAVPLAVMPEGPALSRADASLTSASPARTE